MLSPSQTSASRASAAASSAQLLRRSQAGRPARPVAPPRRSAAGGAAPAAAAAAAPAARPGAAAAGLPRPRACWRPAPPAAASPRARPGPAPAARARGCHVELQVAHHLHAARHPRAGGASASVCASTASADPPAPGAAAASALALGAGCFSDRRALASTIGTPARRCAAQQQVGPDLGLHQHAPRGPVAQEAAHGARRVIGQPGLGVTLAQQLAAGLAARWPCRASAAGAGRGRWRRSARSAVGARVSPRTDGMQPHRARRRGGLKKPSRSARRLRYSGSVPAAPPQAQPGTAGVARRSSSEYRLRASRHSVIAQCAEACTWASGLTLRSAAMTSVLDAVQRLGRVALEAQHQHRRGVGCRGSGRSRRRSPRAGRRWCRPRRRGTSSGHRPHCSNSATTAWCSPSAQGTFSSGVLKLVGRHPAGAGVFSADRISSSRPRCTSRRRSRTSARRRRCGRSSRRRSARRSPSAWP
jgi:hypothetical protein